MRSWRLLAVVAVAAVCSGCRPEYPDDIKYEFRPHPELDKGPDYAAVGGVQRFFGDALPEATKTQVTTILLDHFGTPKNPKVAPLATELQDHPELRLDEATLAKGSSLYRRYCLACHGLMGDASGPTATYIVPKPRDFRKATFKFKSTTGDRPAREDLKKTVRNGIPGSSMPSFNMLKDDEVDALASYVIHLSLRGLVEKFTAQDLGEGRELNVAGMVTSEAERWRNDATDKLIKPNTALWQQAYASPEGAAGGWKKGRDLYIAACANCHGRDGRSSFVEVPDNAVRKNTWGDLQAPRDLTLGQYRGGSRPIDMFYRIRAGITIEGMPPTPQDNELDTWHMVGYVLSLPQQR